MSAARLVTLRRRNHPLAAPAEQRRTLARLTLSSSFEQALKGAGASPLCARDIEVLQINVGKRCNQTCRHCHVDAGPDRREVMPDAVLDACFDFARRHRIHTIDVTGGAPEVHPRFREILRRARSLGCRVIHRCNLTLLNHANYADLPSLCAELQVEIMASLPHYAADATDRQRGEGVFEQSLMALRRLNELGYGREGTGLVLNLITNPNGAFLPPAQSSLEKLWKRELFRRHGIVFNRLFTITNMPISRFLDFLRESRNLEVYMERLVQAFNPCAVAGLMCRSTLSVGWDGRLYDCDFNQMLELELAQTIFDMPMEVLQGRQIRVENHCFGCTAGAGSSCGGATTQP